jgi:hypothetical protein
MKAFSASILLLLVTLAGFPQGAAPSQPSSFPELSPLPIAATLNGMSEPLSVDTLVDSALALSGTPAESMAAERALLVKKVEIFQNETSGILDERQRGESALQYLFSNVIRNYSLMEARVNASLATGVYNCVSSAVLYMILARSIGLSVSGVRTTDHAFCTVMVNGSPVDVETTTPYGFDPGTKKEFKDAFGKVTGFSYVPPSNYRDRKAIGDKELLALILYDRAAVQPLATAYSMAARDDFLRAFSVSISDLAASLGTQDRFQDALSLLREAEAAYGRNIELDRRMSEVFYNNIVSLSRKNAFQEMETLLGSSPKDTPLDDGSWMELSVLLVQMRSEDAAKSGGYLEAAKTVEQSIKKLGRDPRLLQMYEVYIHNQVATLFNAKKYADAKDLLSSAISVFPASQTFAQDLSAVQKTLK